MALGKMTLSLMILYDTKLDGIVHDGTKKNLHFTSTVS